MKKPVLYIIILSCFTFCFVNCTKQSTQTTETANAVPVVKLDTSAIMQKFFDNFQLPDSTRLHISKVVQGDETEKYLLLAELQEIRQRIHSWNNQIDGLPFIFEGTLGPTWDIDIQNHADAAVQINALFLKYDEIVEQLLEGDFHYTGFFYETRSNDATYWLIENSEGAVIKRLRRK